MFSTVERRLLLNNLAVLGGLLLTFAVAVALLFAHSLSTQLDQRLVLLAQAVAGSVESDNGRLELDESIYLGSGLESVPLGETAVVQWFDNHGRLVRSRGRLVLVDAPLQPGVLLTQDSPQRARIYSQLARNPEDGRPLGYVRVALSFSPLEDTLTRLLWQLAGAIALALLLGTLGSLWLTREAMRPVRLSYRRMQQFTADASHELRSPLTAIKLHSAEALRHPDELSADEIRHSFEQIHQSADQIAHLTADLLLLARADEHQGVEEGKVSAISLDALLASLLAQLSVVAEKRHVALISRVESRPTVAGDAEQLTRLFRNLIENALQYTPAGGRVTVVLQQKDDLAMVSVEDTGIGLDPEHIDRVFERFWRADKARSRHSGGSGLGLAIALSIARTHGGDISVSSRPNEGSTFTVSLPRSR